MAEIHYGATLTDFLMAAVAKFPQRPATYFAGHTLTYSELDAQVVARQIFEVVEGARHFVAG